MSNQNMDSRTEINFLKAIEDIVNTSQKQHAEEMKLLNNQHKDVVQELLKQSQSAEANHREAIKEARKQVKYARWAFIVAIIALAVAVIFGVHQTMHCQ